MYGTTEAGGSNGGWTCGSGCGTVFKITQNGTFTTLYRFGGQPDGFFPTAGLVQGTDGNLYGTTSMGGTNCCAGTVFKITLGGMLTTLHSFCSEPNCTDG